MDKFAPEHPRLAMMLIGLVLGIVYIADGFIASGLKTPLQRLGNKIEHSDLVEKHKRPLLSKTQEANEVLKETLKKFGMLALPSLLLGTIEKEIQKEYMVFSYFCYLLPVFYSS